MKPAPGSAVQGIGVRHGERSHQSKSGRDPRRRRVDALVRRDVDVAQPELLAVVQERRAADGQAQDGGGLRDRVAVGSAGPTEAASRDACRGWS